jgi:hypothetical protein
MNPAVPAERPELQNQVSKEIASLVCQLIGLEHIERDYLIMLEQRAALERRIAFLQEMERSQP